MKNILPIILLFSVSLSLVAQKKNVLQPSQPDKAALYEWKQFDVNRINANISSDGPYADYRKEDKAGLEWPKGSGKTAVFTAGIWFVGKHRPTDSLRTAVQYYSTEFQPGPILATFNTNTNDTTVAANPKDSKYRIYKINSGDNELNSIDYAEWPGDLGAPYVDLNNNGKWDKGIDKPKLYGDQTLWSVYNDVTQSIRKQVGVTKPLGLEIQATYFGYDYGGPLRDVMFMKWKVINKSDANYDSVFVGLSSDTDLGDANDDLAGCDTARNLSFYYNGDNNDGGLHGYGSRSPADGFVFLQGPQVQSLNDSALVNGVYKKGLKNLNVHSHVVFEVQGSNDPPFGTNSFAQRALWTLQGMNSYNGLPFIDPTTNKPISFIWPGDPVTGQGWTNIQSGWYSNDFRSIISCGPFSFAPGDTQEIVGAFVIAQGNNRLHSISLLRGQVDIVRESFRTGFSQLPLLHHFSDTITSQNDTSVTVLVNATVPKGSNPKEIFIKFYRSDGNMISIQNLYDDGVHNDSASGDGIFANACTVELKNIGLYGDLFIERDNNSLETYTSLVSIQPLLPVKINKINVLYDEINGDGIINQNERCTVSFTLMNKTPWIWKRLTIDVLKSPSMRFYHPLKTIQFEDLAPFDSSITGSSTITLSVYTKIQKDSVFTLYYEVQDPINFYSWNDSILIPVKVLQVIPIERFAKHTKGIASGSIGVRLVNTHELKDNWYTVAVTNELKFNLINQSTHDTLIRILELNAEMIPFTEGFKITKGTLPTYSNISYGVFETKGANGNSIITRWPDQLPDDPGLNVYQRPNSTYNWGIACRSQTNIYSWSIDQLTSPRFNGEGYDYELRFTSGGSEYYIGRNFDSMLVKAPDKLPFEFWRIRHFEKPPSPLEERLVIHIRDIDSNGVWTATADSLKSESIYAEGPTGPYPDPLPDIDKPYKVEEMHVFDLKIYKPSTVANFAVPASGTVIQIATTQTPLGGDDFTFNPVRLLGVTKDNNIVPIQYFLYQNYPNPFNPSTTIQYSIPVRSRVTLMIFNVLGQRVRTLADDVRDAGNYSVVWNGKDYANRAVASGIYFYQIETERFRNAKKMLMLK